MSAPAEKKARARHGLRAFLFAHRVLRRKVLTGTILWNVSHQSRVSAEPFGSWTVDRQLRSRDHCIGPNVRRAGDAEAGIAPVFKLEGVAAVGG